MREYKKYKDEIYNLYLITKRLNVYICLSDNEDVDIDKVKNELANIKNLSETIFNEITSTKKEIDFWKLIK